MAALVVRREPPVGSAVAIDWDNPDTIGLVVAWEPTQPLLNLASGALFTLTQSAAGAWLTGTNSVGSGFQVSNNANTAYLQNATAGPSSKTEFTLFGVASMGAGRSNNCLISLGDGTAGSGNYVMLYTTFSGGNALVHSRIFTASYQDLDSSAISPVGDGAAHAFGLINSVSQSRREVWCDGLLNASGAALTSGSANNLVATLFNNSNFAGGADNCGYPVNQILIWNRALSAVEMARVSVRPRSVFQRTGRVLPFSIIGGAAGAATRPVVFIAV